MQVTPGGLLILFLAVITILDRRKGTYIFFLVIPLNNLVVIDIIGRGFRPNEVIILALSTHVFRILYNKYKNGTTTIPVTYPYICIISFLLICIISTVYAVVNPPSGLYVYPYNVTSSFGAFDFQEISLSMNNLTQLLMRFFFIGAILVVGLLFRKTDLIVGTKIIIYTSLLSGIIGIFYQITIAVDVYLFSELMNYIGFIRFDLDPVSVGPIPRMYSIQGEPGTVANMLLFALALITVPILSKKTKIIFGKYLDIFIAIVLTGFILLSTGTTGYGGLLILFSVLLVSTFIQSTLSFNKFLQIITVFTILGCVSIVLLATMGVNIVHIIDYQLTKLTFQASSGSIRIRYLLLELEALSQRPALGIGVGSHQSTSVFGTIITDTGLIGFAVFCWMHLIVFRESIRNHVVIDGIPLSTMYSVAGITLFATNMFARDLSSLYFGWYWIALGAPLILHTERIVEYRQFTRIDSVYTHNR